MSQTCPACGAGRSNDATCRLMFDRCLAIEFENPATFGAVHHLTVLCYMLQHNAYARNAWLEARGMLDRFVNQGVSPDEMRREITAAQGAAREKGWMMRGARLAGVEQVEWSYNLGLVRMDSVENYRRDILAWAKAVLADTEWLASAK